MYEVSNALVIVIRIEGNILTHELVEVLLAITDPIATFLDVLAPIDPPLPLCQEAFTFDRVCRWIPPRESQLASLPQSSDIRSPDRQDGRLVCWRW
jgi:hypothetical protein